MPALFYILVLFLAWPVHAAETGASGLPIPRFVSLKSSEVNVRTGPGTRYPIAWVFRRDGMPVEITDEFDHWRKIRDSEGAGGWVHKTMLSGERMGVVVGREARIVREDPAADAAPVLKAAPKVIVKLLECQKEWCKLRIANTKGWLPKAQIWGVYPSETFH